MEFARNTGRKSGHTQKKHPASHEEGCRNILFNFILNAHVMKKRKHSGQRY